MALSTIIPSTLVWFSDMYKLYLGTLFCEYVCTCTVCLFTCYCRVYVRTSQYNIVCVLEYVPVQHFMHCLFTCVYLQNMTYQRR